MKKKLIFAIDTAPANLGSAFAAKSETPVYSDRANLLITGDGRIYAEYEEKLSTELCTNYLRDRWEIIKQADLVIVEKAIIIKNGKYVHNPSETQRACVVVERTLYTILWTYFSLGLGPPVVIVSPKTWQTALGIPTMSYEEHKKFSCAMFEELVGSDYVEFIRSQFPDRKFDDIAEAYLMCQAGHMLFDKLLLQAQRTLNHTTTYQTLGANISSEARIAVPKPLTEGGTITDSKISFQRHMDYQRFCKAKKHDKKYRSILPPAPKPPKKKAKKETEKTTSKEVTKETIVIEDDEEIQIKPTIKRKKTKKTQQTATFFTELSDLSDF